MSIHAKLSELTKWQAALHIEQNEPHETPGYFGAAAFQFGFMLHLSSLHQLVAPSALRKANIPSSWMAICLFDMVVRSTNVNQRHFFLRKRREIFGSGFDFVFHM
jgi:hypothetical protein